MLPVLIFTDKFPHIFAAGAVSPLLHLFINEIFQRVRQGDIHGGHRASLVPLANFGKNFHHSPLRYSAAGSRSARVCKLPVPVS